MHFYQKYHSLLEIDREFIAEIEEMISPIVPSFQWAQEMEKGQDPRFHFTYYLFFGNAHNRPIGLLSMIKDNHEDIKKRSLFQRILRPAKVSYSWSLVSRPLPGIFSHPSAEAEMEKNIQKLLKDIHQSPYESLDIFSLRPYKKALKTQSKDFMGNLTKTHPSFIEYSRSLDFELPDNLHVQYDQFVGEEVYKLKELRKNRLLSLCQAVIEVRPKGVEPFYFFLFHGKRDYLFFSLENIGPEINVAKYLTPVLQYFYQHDQFKYLKPINLKPSQELLRLGFGLQKIFAYHETNHKKR